MFLGDYVLLIFKFILIIDFNHNTSVSIAYVLALENCAKTFILQY